MLALAVLLLVQAAPAATADRNREAAMRRAAEVFGPRIDAPDFFLFDVNAFFVLELEFARDGQVAKASVFPKERYRRSRPEWADLQIQNMSASQVADMVRKLDRIRPLGKLLRVHEGIVIVSNNTAPLEDTYENAVVTRGQRSSLMVPEGVTPPYWYVDVRYARLDARIGPAAASRYRDVKDAEGWLNPLVEACPLPTLTVRAVKMHEDVMFQDLRSTLAALPLEAWPYGRVIGLQRCSYDSTEALTIGQASIAGQPVDHQALRKRTEQLAGDLGLQVRWWPR